MCTMYSKKNLVFLAQENVPRHTKKQPQTNRKKVKMGETKQSMNKTKQNKRKPVIPYWITN